MDSEAEAIRRMAWCMRQAIEALSPADLPLSMSYFPKGACGDTCLLLGAYLIDRGEEGFTYMSGERGSQEHGNWTSHAWLRRDNLIIDITADQFSDAPEGVIVERDSVWHDGFEWEDPQPSDFRVWSGPGTHHLITVYAKLRPVLDELAARA